jgi:hypothetical protein
VNPQQIVGAIALAIAAGVVVFLYVTLRTPRKD